MDDLLAWLTQALDHAERTALAAIAGSRTEAGAEWRHRGREDDWAMVRDADGIVVVYDEDEPDEAQGAHIALHDPRSEIARVRAERAIVDYCAKVVAGRDDDEYSDTGDDAERTLRSLAWGHRFDLAGYEAAWAPVEITTTRSAATP